MQSPDQYFTQHITTPGMAPARPCRVLVAVRPQWKDTMHQLLQHPVIRPTLCHRFEDAHALLARQCFDVVLCSLNFDGGKLHDLLRHIRATPSLRALPFIVGLLDWATFDQLALAPVATIFESLEILGASQCLHIGLWLHRFGTREARLKLHESLLRYAGASPDSTHGDALERAP